MSLFPFFHEKNSSHFFLFFFIISSCFLPSRHNSLLLPYFLFTLNSLIHDSKHVLHTSSHHHHKPNSLLHPYLPNTSSSSIHFPNLQPRTTTITYIRPTFHFIPHLCAKHPLTKQHHNCN